MEVSRGRQGTTFDLCSIPLLWDLVPVFRLWENVLGSCLREISSSASRTVHPKHGGQALAGQLRECRAWRLQPPCSGKGPRLGGLRQQGRTSDAHSGWSLLKPGTVGTSLASLSSWPWLTGLDVEPCSGTYKLRDLGQVT